MVPLDDAVAHVLGAVTPLGAVTVPLAEAAGCVLATDVTSSEDVPPFDNTAVDGYAVRAADVATVPVELVVSGELAAGAVHDGVVAPGCTVRIMTGAPMPPGADAVVMVEDTASIGDGRVRIEASVASGAAIRRRGSDVAAGDVVFRAGDPVHPAVLAVLASINHHEVTVHGRPRVTVLSTGDELIDDGSPLGPGQIRESNRTMLLRLVTEAGCEAIDAGIVPDDEARLERALMDAAGRSDAIVTSGGVSMGDHDVVKAVLGRIADMAWMQLAIKPAKPFAFGTLVSGGRRVPVFGLPGNPVSSLVSFELLARPALRAMAGHRHDALARPRIAVTVESDVVRRRDGKVHFDRVALRWAPDGTARAVRPTDQGSHQLAASALADALLVVPDGEGLRAGERAVAIMLHPA